MTSFATPASVPGPVRLKAQRPDDLLALVPYLLGFHPAESLVAVLVRDGRVLLTARIDLCSVGSSVQEVVDQHRATSVVLVAYSRDQAGAREVLRGQLDALDRVQVADALLVDGARWWSLTCTTGCCPADGLPYEPASHPFAAEAVYAGLAVAAGREAVAALVAGPEPAACAEPRRWAAELRPAVRRLGRAGRTRELATGVVAGLGSTPDGPTCVRLALLAREPAVRDVACSLITREDAEAHAALWQRVVSRVPPELAPAPLCLLGVAGWASGNGTLLNCCCERVLSLDQEHSMGLLLADVSARALPPSLWDALAAELRQDMGLEIAEDLSA